MRVWNFRQRAEKAKNVPPCVQRLNTWDLKNKHRNPRKKVRRLCLGISYRTPHSAAKTASFSSTTLEDHTVIIAIVHPLKQQVFCRDATTSNNLIKTPSICCNYEAKTTAKVAVFTIPHSARPGSQIAAAPMIAAIKSRWDPGIRCVPTLSGNYSRLTPILTTCSPFSIGYKSPHCAHTDPA